MRPWILLLALTQACGDKDEAIADDTGTHDPIVDTVECETDSDCDSTEICEVNECIDGDRNNAIEEAEALLPDDTTEGHFINPAGDEDYFSYTTDGGEFVRVVVTSPDESKSDVDVYDTYITLRDPDLRVIAAVDNYPTGASLSADSYLYAYLSEAGTYTFIVEDNGTYVGTSAYGDDRYEYSLSIETWGRHTEEGDEAKDPGYAMEMDSENSYYALGVALEEADDKDYVSLELPFDNNRLYLLGQLDVLDGVKPQAKLYSEDGEQLMDVSPISGGASGYYPITQDGDYLLELSDEDGDGGDNEWFFLFLYQTGEDTSYPVESEDNNQPIQANVLEATEYSNSSGDYTLSYGLGFADPTVELDKGGKEVVTADEDWYAIEAFDDGYMVLCMNSSAFGSAITPDVAIIDPDGETVLAAAEGEEDEDPTAALENIEVSGGDTYYVKVSSPESAEGTAQEWYEFMLYVADFEIGSYGCPP